MTNFDTAWNYIRFGESGDWILNDENGRMIVRVTKNIDTLFPICKCYENDKFICELDGHEAIEWVLS